MIHLSSIILSPSLLMFMLQPAERMLSTSLLSPLSPTKQGHTLAYFHQYLCFVYFRLCGNLLRRFEWWEARIKKRENLYFSRTRLDYKLRENNKTIGMTEATQEQGRVRVPHCAMSTSIEIISVRSSLGRPGRAVFSPWKFLGLGTVALSLLFGN